MPILSFSTQDYISHSLDDFFEPLPWIFLLCSLVVSYHAWSVNKLRQGTLRSMPYILFITGTILTAESIDNEPEEDAESEQNRQYAALNKLWQDLTAQIYRVGNLPEPEHRIVTWVLSILVCIGWLLTAASINSFGGEVDAYRARRSKPFVIIYSNHPLELSGVGVRREVVADTESWYKYSGLRLLTYADEKYFLISRNWNEDKATLILPDDKNVVVEIVTPTDDSQQSPQSADMNGNEEG